MPCRIVTGEIDGAVVRYRGGTVAALREAWDADPAFVTTSEVDPTCWAEHWSWPSPTTTRAAPLRQAEASTLPRPQRQMIATVATMIAIMTATPLRDCLTCPIDPVVNWCHGTA